MELLMYHLLKINNINQEMFNAIRRHISCNTTNYKTKHLSFNKPSEEDEWLKLNLNGKIISITLEYTSPHGRTNSAEIYFDNKEDITLFKLTWG